MLQFIHNMRRSPQMSESFEFDVVGSTVPVFVAVMCSHDQQAYSTSFEQIERLRELMLSFLKVERRDYQPIFDVYVVGAFASTSIRLGLCGG